MSEYVHHYSKIQVNNVAKVRDWLQAGSLPKSSLPLQTSNEVDTQAQRMKTLSLSEARRGEFNSNAEDNSDKGMNAISKVKEDFYRADETLTSRCTKLKNNVLTNVSSKTAKSEERHCICRDCSLNELCSMFPKLNPHQLYQVLVKNQFDLQRAIDSLLDIPPSSTSSRNISKTDSSLPEHLDVPHSRIVSVTSRTKPLNQLRTEITVKSRTRRRSPTISETKSSLVSSNISSSTPRNLDTSSIQAGHRSLKVSVSLPVSPVSPVSQSVAPPAMPPCPECPVCFTSLAGSRIYQCAQGHSLCGDCNKNPRVKNCPTCRGKLVGRATNMEQLLASIYSGE